VGTPSSDTGEADLSAVEAVAREIAGCISGYKLVVEKSTVPVTTSERIRQVLLWNGALKECFDVASNPEFLREGTAVTDFLYPDRIVVGADSRRAATQLKEIYKPLSDGSYAVRTDAIPAPDGQPECAKLIHTSARSAELIKHASNAFLAMKISFINAVSNICEQVGADVREVCEGMGSDARIGAKFLRPGVGYGGSCFPKDLLAFRAVARELGYDFQLLTDVININAEQRNRFINKVRKTLWTLKGKRLAALGLSFKGGTDDVRESPALAIIQALLSEGCEIRAYDPAAMEQAQRAMGDVEGLSFAHDPYEAAEGADAILILTDWDEVAELDFARLAEVVRYHIVIDGRNMYTPAQMANTGFMYVSVGRSDVLPTLHLKGNLTQVKKAA
jgi:UDPglucose 6-dehydrogenase